MISITKEFHFSAAHRIEGHPKCGRLHGHNYKVEVTCIAPQNRGGEAMLSSEGFVIDFGDLKKIAGEVIDQLDHRYLVSSDNVAADDIFYIAANQNLEMTQCWLLNIPQTSAEYLAAWLKEEIQMKLAVAGFQHVAVAEVTVWETPTACARA